MRTHIFKISVSFHAKCNAMLSIIVGVQGGNHLPFANFLILCDPFQPKKRKCCGTVLLF